MAHLSKGRPLSSLGYFSFRESLEFKGDAPDPQTVEHTLAVLEGNYATALREAQQTITQRKSLTQEQKYILSHFIAVQWRRTPEYRRTLVERVEKVSTKFWEMTHPHEKVRFKLDEKSAPIVQAQDIFSPHINDAIIQVLMSHIWIIGSTPLTGEKVGELEKIQRP